MTMGFTNTNIRTAARVSGVCEVTLMGTADLSYWQHYLDTHRLSPVSMDGKAQLMIVSADARFLGVTFQEISLSVHCIHKHRGAVHEGWYLVQAYNSRSLFAFVERARFATPYLTASCSVKISPPQSIRLTYRGALVLGASRGSSEQPDQDAEKAKCDNHEFMIFLRGQRLFCARIMGLTQRIRFNPDIDEYSVDQASIDLDGIGSLQDSMFTPTEWVIRPDASHIKSKTYESTAIF